MRLSSLPPSPSGDVRTNSFNGILQAHGVTALPSERPFNEPYVWNIDYTPYRKGDLTALSLDSLSFANHFQSPGWDVQTVVDGTAAQMIHPVEANIPVVVDEFVALARNTIHRTVSAELPARHQRQIYICGHVPKAQQLSCGYSGCPD